MNNSRNLNFDLARLLGKKRAPVTNLFSLEQKGWIDLVDLNKYPNLADMIEFYKTLVPGQLNALNRAAFRFPESLDDFGICEFFARYYPGKYPTYLDQWNKEDGEIIKQQIEFQKQYQHNYPSESKDYLYMMIFQNDGIDRVAYVGQTTQSMLIRFFNNKNIRAQDNNYIGDCRSIGSRNKPNYTWRAKSAELRRRGVSDVVWFEIGNGMIDRVESELIRHKRILIEESCGINNLKDPINWRE